MNVKITIVCMLMLLILLGCDSSDDEQEANQFQFLISATAATACDSDQDSVSYTLDFLVDDKIQQQVVDTVAVKKDLEHAFVAVGSTFTLALRLVDYDPDTPAVDKGELLEDLSVLITDMSDSIQITEILEDLFICDASVYGVDIIYDLATEEVTTEYYKDDAMPDTETIDFVLSGNSNLGCNTSVSSVNYTIDVIVDGEVVEERLETINEIESFENTFSATGTTFTLALQLVDYDPNNPAVDKGEVLENLSILITNTDTQEEFTETLENLFICDDSVYGLDLVYHSETGITTVEYYSVTGTVDDRTIQAEVRFETATGGIVCDQNPSNEMAVKVKYYQNGDEVSGNSFMIPNTTQQFAETDTHLYSSDATQYTIELILEDYDPQDPMSGSGQLVGDIQFEFRDHTGQLLVASSNVAALFLCAEDATSGAGTYIVRYTYDTATGTGEVSYETAVYDPPVVDSTLTATVNFNASMNLSGCELTSLVDFIVEVRYLMGGEVIDQRTFNLPQDGTVEAIKDTAVFPVDTEEVTIQVKLPQFSSAFPSNASGSQITDFLFEFENATGSIDSEKDGFDSLIVCNSSTQIFAIYQLDLTYNPKTDVYTSENKDEF